MAEKKVIELEVSSNLGNLKQQLKQAQVEVQSLSEKFGATSKQAVEAAKAAAILKDKIGDAKALTDAFNPDAKFKAVTGALTGVAGGFSVLTGAMGAFGKQNEDVEKAILKVQSAMAIASGLQAIGESIDSFKQLGAVIKSTSIFQGIYNFVQTGGAKATAEATVAKVIDAEATVAQGTATVATTVATTGASASLKLLRAALVATGVGAFVAVVGGLISSLTGAKNKTKELTDAEKASIAAAKEQSTAIATESSSFVLLIQRLKDTNAGSKEREKLIKQVNTTYGTTFSNLKSEKQFQADLNFELENYLKLQRAKYDLQKNEKAVIANFEKQDELAAKRLELEKEIEGWHQGSFSNTEKRTLAQQKADLLSLESHHSAQITINDLKKIEQAEIDNANALAGYGVAANKAAGQVEKLTEGGKKFTDQTEKEKKAADDAAEAIQKQKDKQKAAIEKARELAKEARAKEAEALKLHNDNLTAFYDAIETERQAKITNEKEKEEQELANKYEKLYELADKAKKSTKDLQEQQGKDSQAITKKYNDLEKVAKDEKDKEKVAKDKEQVAKDKAFLEEITLTESQLKLSKLTSQYEAEKLLYKDNKEILKALDIKYAKDKEVLENEELAKKQATLQKQLDLVKGSFQAFADVATLFAGKNKKAQKAAFNIQKGANIAATTIDTYTAAMAAYKSALAVPVIGTALAPVAAAGAVAVGLMNIKKIAASQFEGGGTPSTGGNGGGATAPTMSAPQFNVVGQSGVNQLASLNQQPIQAYVVSGQVTSQQALDRNRLANATLGG